MKRYDVQEILIDAPADRVFGYLADASNSPEWTEAFDSVDGDRAVLRTPAGAIEIGLDILASSEQGTVDWRMRFPDGTVETAWARVVPTPDERTVFTFVLMPSAPMLEQLEGDLSQLSETLAGVLVRLTGLLEIGVDA